MDRGNDTPAHPLELSLTRMRTPWGGWPDGVGEIRSVSGPPFESMVLNGELTGCGITELAGRYQRQIMGNDMEMDVREPFPVRLRFLRTTIDLPVEIHPYDSYTLAHMLPMVGQEKVLYVLASSREARLFCGWREPSSMGRLQRALAEDKVRDLLHPLRVRPGQIFTIPPERPYALGKGLTVFEVARHTDAGFQLSLARHREIPPDLLQNAENDTALPEPIHGIPFPCGKSRIDYLCCTPRFFLRRFSVLGSLDLDNSEGRFRVLTGLRGSGKLMWGFSGSNLPVQRFQSILVPAFHEDLSLESLDGMEVMEFSLTDLAGGTMEKLSARGIPEAQVAALGGGDYRHIIMDYIRGHHSG